MAESFDDLGTELLTYWFGTDYWKKTNKDPSNCSAYYDDLWVQKWFAKEELQPVVDDYLRNRYGSHIERGIKGEYDSWCQTADGSLALIVMLDQFSRNVFRNTPGAWASDAKALELCLEAIKKGQDRELKWVPRAMLYMPLMHAEDMAMATLSVEKFNAVYDEAEAAGSLTVRVLARFKKIADIHYNSIKLFGRYPERNKYLNRASTFEELAYLKG